MKQIIILALLIFITAGCGPSLETLATQTTDAETAITATPTEFLPTITPTATMEPTPEVPRPAISPNLAPINNASMAYENGTWVTKNATGKTTATFTETGWKYNNDNIAVEVIGWQTRHYPFELTRDKHPECFIKPEVNGASLDFISNGQPVADGFLKDTEVSFTGDMTATYAWFVGRYVGNFMDTDMIVEGQPSMVVCVRLGDALVPIIIDTNDIGTEMYFIQGNDLLQPPVISGQQNRQMQKTISFLPIGRQVVMMVPFNIIQGNSTPPPTDILKVIVDALKRPIRGEGAWVDIRSLPITWGIPEELIQK